MKGRKSSKLKGLPALLRRINLGRVKGEREKTGDRTGDRKKRYFTMKDMKSMKGDEEDKGQKTEGRSVGSSVCLGLT